MKKSPMAKFLGIGFEAVALILAGAWIGQYLDETYALKGLGTAGAVISALVIWLAHVLFMLRNVKSTQ